MSIKHQSDGFGVCSTCPTDAKKQKVLVLEFKYGPPMKLCARCVGILKKVLNEAFS